MSENQQPQMQFRAVSHAHIEARILMAALQVFAAKRAQQNEQVFRRALRS